MVQGLPGPPGRLEGGEDLQGAAERFPTRARGGGGSQVLGDSGWSPGSPSPTRPGERGLGPGAAHSSSSLFLPPTGSPAERTGQSWAAGRRETSSPRAGKAQSGLGEAGCVEEAAALAAPTVPGQVHGCTRASAPGPLAPATRSPCARWAASVSVLPRGTGRPGLSSAPQLLCFARVRVVPRVPSEGAGGPERMGQEQLRAAGSLPFPLPAAPAPPQPLPGPGRRRDSPTGPQ